MGAFAGLLYEIGTNRLIVAASADAAVQDLVAPQAREREVVEQMSRPSLNKAQERFQLGYLPAEELKQNCDAMCKFGVNHTVLLKIARSRGLATSSPA